MLYVILKSEILFHIQQNQIDKYSLSPFYVLQTIPESTILSQSQILLSLCLLTLFSYVKYSLDFV
jgi:hypothetical protein